MKGDLRDNYPFGLFAVPLSEVVRIHGSSGTTGKPIVVGYTRDDISLWSEVMCRTFQAIGLTPATWCRTPTVRPVHGRAGRALRPRTPRRHSRADERRQHRKQILVMHDFGVTAICCTPSYFCSWPRRREGGLSVRKTKLKRGIFGAEPCRTRCACASRRAPVSRPMTSSACRRSSAPASRPNASATAACTCSRTTSTRRSSTRIPARCSAGSRGELVFSTITKQALPSSGTAPGTCPRSTTTSAVRPDHCAHGPGQATDG